MAELYNEMLVRSVDCGLLYFQIKDNEAIKEYEDLKKEKKLMENENADDKKLAKIQKRIEELSKEIFSMKKPITFSDKDNRFYYSGTMADSLMGRKLRQVAKNRGEYEKVTIFRSFFLEIRRFVFSPPTSTIESVSGS